MASRFDTSTAVTKQDDHRFGAVLDGGWQVGGGLNGGYLLAVVGRAIRASLPDHPDPLTISAHYLTATTPGPAVVEVTPRRVGRGTSTVLADLVQGEGDDAVTRITALACFGDLGREEAPVRTTAAEPALPPREQCVSNTAAPESLRAIAPLMERFEMLFHPDQVGWATGSPDGSGVLSAWFRLEDDRDPDPLSLLLAVDALPPVSFTLGNLGWAPTIELTAHVRARPAPGWLRLRHATRNVAGTMFEEDCEVWDDAGRLVAQSRQLARLPR